MPRGIPIYAKKYAMTDLGKCIVQHRARLGLTQAQLAEKMGVTQQTISHMEKNPGSITQADMFALREILGLDLLQFVKAYGYTTKQTLEYFREYL